MGFYSDWIAKTERLLNAVPYAACSPASREEHGIFSALLAQVKGAKIIRLSGEQADVFIDMPRIDGQDFNWLRMPFLHTYVALDKPFAFHGYVSGYREEPAACVNVRGILVNDWDMTRVPSLKITGAPPGATRILQVVFFVPLADDPGNVHIASLCVAGDKLVIDEHGKDWGTRQRMLTWLIHVVNFLSSPSVKLAQASPDAALQKARARRGKDPLPGWYEITYRKVCHDYTPGPTTDKAWEHGFRYDVRGHFKRFEKGRMAGRVVWCPPHQRGLKHDLYKPKTYRVGCRADEVPVWTGGER